VTLPKLSIAAKLYVIFALLATMTLALSIVAVFNARHHATLTDAFEALNTGSRSVERINGLIAVVSLQSHSLIMTQDPAMAVKHAAALRKAGDAIKAALAQWQQAQSANADDFGKFAVHIAAMQNFAYGLADVAGVSGLEAARAWRDKNYSAVSEDALDKELEQLSRYYTGRAQQIYAQIDRGIDQTAMWLSVFAALAVMLATAGMLVISRGIALPLAGITRITEAVAAGDTKVAVPFRERSDEIGALARSIGVFQLAMHKNEELKRTVVGDAETRAKRQQYTSSEIARFSADVEATLSELGRISDQMLAASTQLAGAADDATAKTARAAAASAEASTNVRDIASAADQLSASVNEIDRQVAQSNGVAVKAVTEAERTNVAVKELDEAASRIGDVVKLITDIAEQTNLLALNATIEAARAGEAGRGFAVVAGEVKALAGQTGRATEEIGAQIAGMQRATRRSIEAITAIEHTIREIGDISGAIAAAVTEQGAATQEIARSVEIAAKRTGETADEVGFVGAATEDTRTSATTVKAVADDLGQVAGRIRAQVDQFFERLSA
jgi:methyl-accepting chemotaxis protein